MFNVTQSFRVTHAVITAAVIAGIFTAVTGPGNRMVVSAVATPSQVVSKSCDEPWPYLNCTGGQAIRVIKIN